MLCNNSTVVVPAVEVVLIVVVVAGAASRLVLAVVVVFGAVARVVTAALSGLCGAWQVFFWRLHLGFNRFDLRLHHLHDVLVKQVLVKWHCYQPIGLEGRP